MALEIVVHPAKVLTRPSRKVERADLDEVRRLVPLMRETMEEIGVGLAAPQVGKSLRLFLAMDVETELIHPYVNPQIIAASQEKSVGKEGCLSIPGQIAYVQRHLAIMLRYQDLDLKEHEQRFDGYNARIIQHELDHLNGILLMERAVDGMHPDVEEEEDGDAPAGETRRERMQRKRQARLAAQAQPALRPALGEPRADGSGSG